MKFFAMSQTRPALHWCVEMREGLVSLAVDRDLRVVWDVAVQCPDRSRDMARSACLKRAIAMPLGDHVVTPASACIRVDDAATGSKKRRDK